MKNARIVSIIAVVVPIACAIVLGLMCASQVQRRELDRATEQQQQGIVASLETEKTTVSIEPLMGKSTSFPETPDEQAQFLTQLRMNAQAAGVKLVQYMNMGVVMPPANNQNGNQAQTQQTFRPVASTLTVQGPYDGVRAFAFSLLRANRLMNMNGVTWKRDSQGNSTTLSFTLIRYVTDPETEVTTTAAESSRPSSGGAL